MFVEQLIKKKEECIISGFLEEGGVFLLLAGCPPSLLSFFLYPRKPYSLFYKIVLPSVDCLHLSTSITIFLKQEK
jgi:hypothetical protein